MKLVILYEVIPGYAGFPAVKLLELLQQGLLTVWMAILLASVKAVTVTLRK